MLKSIGAEHVFNSSEEGWKTKAKELADKLNVTIGFDCIGGTATSDLADLIVDGGVVYNYGLLSGQPSQFGSNHLIFQRKRLEGLWLTPWLQQKSTEERVEIGYKIQNLLDQVFKTEYSKEVTLSQVKEALIDYSQNSTNNKILIKTVV